MMDHKCCRPLQPVIDSTNPCNYPGLGSERGRVIFITALVVNCGHQPDALRRPDAPVTTLYT